MPIIGFIPIIGIMFIIGFMGIWFIGIGIAFIMGASYEPDRTAQALDEDRDRFHPSRRMAVCSYTARDVGPERCAR
jgi:hypothetical protein